MHERMLRRREVEAITGLSRSTIYAGMGAGWFPKNYRLGPRSVGWRQSDIDDWIGTRDRRGG